MSERADSVSAESTSVTVRYWAAAKAAAGVEYDVLPAGSLASVLDQAVALRGAHLGGVVRVCSVLIDDEPLGVRDPREVPVRPGQTVELLPPFAGG